MLSIKMAVAVAAFAVTASATIADSSPVPMPNECGATSALAEFEAPEECVSPADAAWPEIQGPGKATPTFGYCYDSDGGDSPYVAGYLIDVAGGQWQDYCQNQGLLVEKYCSPEGLAYHVTHSCTCVSEWIYVPGWGNRYAGKCQS